MIKLIACDIDGTLLKPKQTAIKEEVFSEIKRLIDKNIYFCAATGRQYNSLKHLFEPIKDDIYYICENGGVVFSKGSEQKVISKTVMPLNECFRLIDFIVSINFCEVLISGENTVYVIPKDMSFVDYIRNVVHNKCEIIKSPNDIKEEIIKISVCCSKGTDYFLNQFKNFDTPLNPVISGSEWVDFTLSDKGSGLVSLCRELDIDLKDVMAIGDNYNDLPLLNIVGYSYIMSTADEKLKEKFNNICFSVEDTLKNIN